MKRFINRLIIISFLILCFSLIGCAQANVPKQEQPKQKVEQKNKQNIEKDTKKEPNKAAPKTEPTLKPADFFPLGEGYLWEYKGEGNEYASFNRKVVYTKGDLAQIREDNGGTVTASVFKTTSDAITRVYFLGEAYGNTNYLNSKSNVNIVILKAPLKVGTKWSEANGSKEIVSTDATVTTPAGEFTQCIQLKIANADSTVYEYYKKDIGLVKREFISGESKITSSLLKFSKTSK